MNNLDNKKVLLVICGGIAAYKSLEIIRLLKKKGSLVKTVLTKNAQKCEIRQPPIRQNPAPLSSRTFLSLNNHILREFV